MANVTSRDLSQLRTLGVKGVAGSLTAKARVEKTKTQLHIDADVSAQRLVVQQNRVGKLDVHVHDQDFIGEAHVTAEGVRASGVALDTLKLDASGDPKAVQAKLRQGARSDGGADGAARHARAGQASRAERRRRSSAPMRPSTR